MKRIFALLLALAIVAFAAPAMAEQTEFTIIGGQSAMSCRRRPASPSTGTP